MPFINGMQEVGGSIPPGSTSLRSLRELRLGKSPTDLQPKNLQPKNSQQTSLHQMKTSSRPSGGFFVALLLTATPAALHDARSRTLGG